MIRTVHFRAGRIDDGRRAVERPQEPKKGSCDASTTNHRHRCTMKRLALAIAPTIPSCIAHQTPPKREHHAERKLSNRFSEGTTRTGPQSAVVDEVQICIDARGCQLNPRRARILKKQFQLPRLITTPDDTIKAVRCCCNVTSPRSDRQLGPLQRRSDMNSRC